MTGVALRVVRFVFAVMVAALIVGTASAYMPVPTSSGPEQLPVANAPPAATPPPGGGGGGGGVPTPTPAPPPPPQAGFSAASWGGPPDGQQLPNTAYDFGLVGADGGSYCTGSTNPHLLHAVQTIAAPGSGAYYGIFWFLTGVDWAKVNCGYTQSAAQWGIDQANHFLSVLSAMDQSLTPAQQADMGPAIADVEGWLPTAGATWWWKGNQSGNRDTILNFISTLAARGYLNNAIYTGIGQWPDIVGPYTSTSIPNVGTTQIWLADYTYDLATLNGDQQFFTTSPGGFSIYSWQTSDDSCQQSVYPYPNCQGYAYSANPGYDCYVTFSEAQAMAAAAAPPIPRFDKWTNSNPETLCLPPPKPF